jgi:hypothetical protein
MIICRKGRKRLLEEQEILKDRQEKAARREGNRQERLLEDQEIM